MTKSKAVSELYSQSFDCTDSDGSFLTFDRLPRSGRASLLSWMSVTDTFGLAVVFAGGRRPFLLARMEITRQDGKHSREHIRGRDTQRIEGKLKKGENEVDIADRLIKYTESVEGRFGAKETGEGVHQSPGDPPQLWRVLRAPYGWKVKKTGKEVSARLMLGNVPLAYLKETPAEAVQTGWFPDTFNLARVRVFTTGREALRHGVAEDSPILARWDEQMSNFGGIVPAVGGHIHNPDSAEIRVTGRLWPVQAALADIGFNDIGKRVDFTFEAYANAIAKDEDEE